MKKIMVLFAAAALVVACGGNSKKGQSNEQKAAEQGTECCESDCCAPETDCCEPETDCCEPVTDCCESDCCEQSCGDDCTCDVEAIASKVRMFNDKMLNAIMNDDFEAVEKITAEGQAWFESLSEEELAVAEAAQAQWEEENAEKLGNL